MFGEIEDETQLDIKPSARISDSSLIVPGSIKIEEFNENYLFMVARFGGLKSLGENLENSMLPVEEELETLGGFIFDLFGRFPTEGESVEYGGLRFTVLKIQKKRISEIKVEVLVKEVSYVA